jgi:hypothetical protein
MIDISVKRVEIFQRNPENLETDIDVDNYLKNFCKANNILIYYFPHQLRRLQ